MSSGQSLAHKYFEDTLPLDQLKRGNQLPRPFQHINEAIKMFSTFTHPDTPDEMKPRKGTQTGKWQQGGELNNNNKWPCNSLFTPCSFTLPENLAKLRQTAQNKLPIVALS